ncbi:MAG: hypothetical protein QG632_66 [Candidatus Dependentiae bacterium]|nr:hypothetical protein [Candidatus Dependentiae bacterium]
MEAAKRKKYSIIYFIVAVLVKTIKRRVGASLPLSYAAAQVFENVRLGRHFDFTAWKFCENCVKW